MNGSSAAERSGSDYRDVSSCRRRQLEEIEVLMSMYPGPDELIIDEVALTKIKSQEQSTDDLHFAVSFLDEDLKTEGESPQLCITLPPLYPHKSLRAELLSSYLPTHRLAECEEALKERAREWAERGEECVVDIVQSAKDSLADLVAEHRRETEELENALQAAQAAADDVADDDEEDDMSDDALAEELQLLELQASAAARPPAKQQQQLGRRVCYSHHIRAETKRRYIIQWALELRLGGFSKIGYPGVVIVEGPEEGCMEYITRLQRLRWKHFVVRGEEIIDVPASKCLDDMRRLPRGFEELGPKGMGRMADECRKAGLGALFLTCMKMYRDESTGNGDRGNGDETAAKPGRKKGK
ncbi:unnamed protein product [Vitrella brassicaformis CCMP3155]|uniref:RWD domain-containing protein n=1 Tax=Vitrella brassicaformis (strain CCMP3155) TaxID=1169540 RepID=A0A0G4GTF1_VITBC|nr:unnamed protein product [Vitrella brassicaformis CCMP3155]|eukprot:CEM34052.1 unnamed protein product [Vitrella brassicaformis CCMP3155]